MKEYRDHYFLKAQTGKSPARSVYKLKEIDGRFKIFRKGMKVLDLGAAPRLVVAWRGGTRGRSGQGAGLRYPEHGHRFSSQCGIPSGRTCSGAPRLLSGSSPKRGPSMSS